MTFDNYTPIIVVAYDLAAFKAILAAPVRTQTGPILVDDAEDDFDGCIIFGVETTTGVVQLRLDLNAEVRGSDELESKYEKRMRNSRIDAIKAVIDSAGQPVYRGRFRDDLDRGY